MSSSQSPESEEGVNNGSCQQRSVSQTCAKLNEEIQKRQREVEKLKHERDLYLGESYDEWQGDSGTVFRSRVENAIKKISELESLIASLKLELLVTEWFGPILGLVASSPKFKAHLAKRLERTSLPNEYLYLEYMSVQEKKWFVDVSNQIKKRLEDGDLTAVLSMVEPKSGAKPLKYLPRGLRLLCLDVLCSQCGTNCKSAEKCLDSLKTRRAELLQLFGQARIRFSPGASSYIFPILDDLYKFIDEQVLSSEDAVHAYSSRINSISFLEHIDYANQSVLIKHGLLDKRILSGLLNPSISYGCVQFAKSIVEENQKSSNALKEFEQWFNNLLSSARPDDNPNVELESILAVMLSMRKAEAVSRDCLRRARNRPMSYCAHPEAVFSQELSINFGELMTKIVNFAAPMFTKSTADLVAQVNSMSERDDADKASIQESSKNHLMLIFKYLELILENETFRREDINFWKQAADGESEKFKSVQEVQLTKSRSCLGFVEQHKIFYNACRKKLEEVLISSGIHESLADRKARKLKERNAPVEVPEELADRVTSLTRIEPELVRVTHLLRRIDSLFQGPKSRELEGEASDVVISVDRDECRLLLAELLSAESQLRSLVCMGILEEKEKIDLWQRRVLVAEKIEDSYLALRARRRLQIHEESLRLLRTALSEDLELSDNFREALVAVEAVERNLGLVANTIPGRTNVVAAMTLFDRVLFLSENLLQLMKSAVGEQEQDKELVAGDDGLCNDTDSNANEDPSANGEHSAKEDPRADGDSRANETPL